MAKFWLFLLLAFPLFELWLMIVVGSVIGGLTMVALVITTAIVGGYLARQQGFATFARLREKTRNNQPIVFESIEAVALLVAGILLILPGIITDMIGFLLLITPLRHRCATAIASAILTQTFSSSPQRSSTVVIDIDVNTDDDDHTKTPSL